MLPLSLLTHFTRYGAPPLCFIFPVEHPVIVRNPARRAGRLVSLIFSATMVTSDNKTNVASSRSRERGKKVATSVLLRGHRRPVYFLVLRLPLNCGHNNHNVVTLATRFFARLAHRFFLGQGEQRQREREREKENAMRCERKEVGIKERIE